MQLWKAGVNAPCRVTRLLAHSLLCPRPAPTPAAAAALLLHAPRPSDSSLAFPEDGSLPLLKCAVGKVGQLLDHTGFTGQATEVDDTSQTGSKWHGQPGFRWVGG
jgi:hypothetical protein